MKGEVRHAITVPLPPAKVYDVVSDLRRLTEWLTHLESVQPTGDRTSRWTLKNPDGSKAVWETEITLKRPGQVFAWSSVGGDVTTYTSIELTPVGTGTRVDVRRLHDAGRGRDPAALAHHFADPEAKLHHDLARLQAILVREGARRAAPPKPKPTGPVAFQRLATRKPGT